jgi:predicted nucleic acid-binding protein
VPLTVAYLDTSAAMKLVVDEPASAALVAELAAHDDRRLVASWLLHAELHCAAGRHSDDVDLEAVRAVLDTVDLVDLTRGDVLAAGTHASLPTNDAIHLAVALRVGADELITYDAELAERAGAVGLSVLAPGSLPG